MKSGDVRKTRIAPISRAQAEDFLARFEILGNVGLGVWHWGLLFEHRLLSVITFGTTCFGGRRGWIARVGNAFDMRVLQLCRGGTLPGTRKGVPSRAISLACHAMRELYGPFIAVAYADETLGEIGTIYQASGALYTGVTRPKGQANYIIEGKQRSAWQVRRMYGTRDRKRLREIDPSVEVLLLKPKHRYLLIGAGKPQRERILSAIAGCIRPYPKRSQSKACIEFRYGHASFGALTGYV